MKQCIPLAPGMEIGYVLMDARKWEGDPERTASKFDALYYRGLLKRLGRKQRLYSYEPVLLSVPFEDDLDNWQDNLGLEESR